jgi:hypothetical protein
MLLRSRGEYYRIARAIYIHGLTEAEAVWSVETVDCEVEDINERATWDKITTLCTEVEREFGSTLGSANAAVLSTI